MNYSELVRWDIDFKQINHLNIKGFFLSGGPDSVASAGAPTLPDFVINSKLPVLGICYGIGHKRFNVCVSH